MYLYFEIPKLLNITSIGIIKAYKLSRAESNACEVWFNVTRGHVLACSVQEWKNDYDENPK